MSLSTRTQYRTRNAIKTRNIPQFQQLTSIPRRHLRPRNTKKLLNIFYSDEEQEGLQERESELGALQGLEISKQDSVKDEESQIQQMQRKCVPPKKGKKYKINQLSNNLTSKAKKKTASTDALQQIKLENEQQPHSKQKQYPKIKQQAQGSLQAEETNPSSPSQPDMQKVMVEQLAARLAQKEKERRQKFEKQMKLLANMDGQSLSRRPFHVFKSYKDHLQSRTQIQYRQFLTKYQIQKNIINQKIKFSLSQNREHAFQQHQDLEAQMYNKYKQRSDALFYKCKDMDQNSLVQYKKTQEYNQNLARLIPSHPYNLLLLNGKKKNSLKISQTINEKFVVVHPKKQRRLGHFTLSACKYSYQSSNPAYSNKMSQLCTKAQKFNKAQNHNKTELNQQSASDPIIEAALQQILNEQQLSDYLSHFTPNQLKDIKSASELHEFNCNPSEATNDRRIEIQKRFSQNEQDYSVSKQAQIATVEGDKQRILQMIHSVNQKNQPDKKTSILENSEIQSQQLSSPPKNKQTLTTFKSTTINTDKPFVHQPTRGKCNTQDLQNFEFDRIHLLEGLQQIQTAVQSVDKTQPTLSRPQQLSAYTCDFKKISSSQPDNYESFYRGPKVKRLQILNRFHYNPFEQGNGEDQCDLWRRVMSEEVQDLKSYYKYEEPNEYFTKENQKYQKGFVIPVKVSQQDFILKTLYDPSTKSMMPDLYWQTYKDQQQKQHSNPNNQVLNSYYSPQANFVKAEPNEDFLQIPNNREIIKDQFIDQIVSQTKQLVIDKHQKSTPENIKNEEKNVDQSDKSFNLDQLQDFYIPELQKQETGQFQLQEVNLLKQQDEKLFQIQFF